MLEAKPNTSGQSKASISEDNSFSKINPHAAGIDIGSEKIYIGIEGIEVRSFSTFTDDYLKSISYLKEKNITTIAMEATGVYWFAYYELLEASGFDVYLVNGNDTKNLPGRKSDVEDCQWIQQLHSFGLLRRCFIPEDIIRQLRTYTRLRDDHISMASQHIQHMQKAFDLMNIKLHNVISQIHGVSGLRIVNAIIQGNHDPVKLAELCEKSILKKKRDSVIASLKGTYKQEHIFSLKQALQAYEFYQNQIRECDNQMELLLFTINLDIDTPKNITKAKPARHNNPNIENLHKNLMIITGGKDPAQITGLSDKSLLELIAETGTNLQDTWKTEKHFTSWLCLSPGKNQSGKRNKKSKKKGHTRAGQIFRNAAYSIVNSKYSALAGFYHRIKSKKGAKIAIKALARKIAVLYYNIMTKGIEYVEQGLINYQEKFKEQQLKRLQKQAKQLGLQLVAA